MPTQRVARTFVIAVAFYPPLPYVPAGVRLSLHLSVPGARGKLLSVLDSFLVVEP